MNEFIELLGIARGMGWVSLCGVFLAATALLLFDRGRRTRERRVEPRLRVISLEREVVEEKKRA